MVLEPKHPEVATTLPWTTGSFYAAVEYAYLNRTITCSPVSGFHHSEFNRAMGFCTFNGLMVAAIKLKQKFTDIKIGILDCDHHYGNGTDDILIKNNIDYVKHYTFGGQEADHYHWNGGASAELWITRLPDILKAYFKDVDIIFYQAGADPHQEDPHGGALTSEQLARRDHIVFDFASQKKLPITWNLAGGYLEPIEKVLQLHGFTLDAAINFLQMY